MAEEEAVEVTETKKSGGKLGLILMVVGLLVAVGGGLVVYFLVIAPRFAADETVVEDPMEPKDVIPQNPVYYSFDAAYVNLMRDGDGPASTLLYKVNFECSDQATHALVHAYKQRFVDMLNKLHDSRTRAEVDDILLFKESVQRQALQKSNDILQQIIPPDVKEKDRSMYRITAVLHDQCMVADQG